MTEPSKKTFIKLGYSHLDTAEIVTLLNRLLSSYSLHQHNLRNFKWNIEGAEFIELTRLFGRMQMKSINEIDKIAERIRLLGQQPVTLFKEYQKLSVIEEKRIGLTPFEMVNEILEDIRQLRESIDVTIRAAKKINDHGTEFMLQSFIYQLEIDHGILTAWTRPKA